MAEKFSVDCQVASPQFEQGRNIRKSKYEGDLLKNQNICQNSIQKDAIKRPQLKIYRPGMGLLQKHLNDSDDYTPDGEEKTELKLDISNGSNALEYPAKDGLLSEEFQNIGNLNTSNCNDSGCKKSRNRRPDKAVYVPKPKILATSLNCPTYSEKKESRNSVSPQNVLKLSEFQDQQKSADKILQKSGNACVRELVHSDQQNNLPNRDKAFISKNESPKNMDSCVSYSEPIFQTTSNEKKKLNDINQLAKLMKQNVKIEHQQNSHNKDVQVGRKIIDGCNQMNKSTNISKNERQISTKNKAKAHEGNRNSNKRNVEIVLKHSENDDKNKDFHPSPSTPPEIATVLDRSVSRENIFSITENPSKSTKLIVISDESCKIPSIKQTPTGSRKGRGRSRPIGKIPNLIFESTSAVSKNSLVNGRLNRPTPGIYNPILNSESLTLRSKQPTDILDDLHCPYSNKNEFHKNLPLQFQNHNFTNKESVSHMTEELKMEKWNEEQTIVKRAGMLRLPVSYESNSDLAFKQVITPEEYTRSPVYSTPTKQLYNPLCVNKQSVISLPTQKPNTSNFNPNSAFHISSLESFSVIHQTPTTSLPPAKHVSIMNTSVHPRSSSEHMMRHSKSNSKRLKPIVEKNLRDASGFERELNGFISKGLENVDSKALAQCRWKLQLRYENIILADPRFCVDRNIENSLWKGAFYQVIEAFRKIKEQQPLKEEEINAYIINLVEEGTSFYESLLEKQQETFGINLSQFLNPEKPRPHTYPDNVKLIFLSIQKIFICLGDLARYREQASNTTNYGKARSWYLKAQQIAPKNGRPYNQLAILAIYARRKLDAVYYYMRSLAASNPFLSARESLLSLFDEARKKYEATEKKKLEESLLQKKELETINSHRKFEDRIEIWLFPDGCKRTDSTKDNSAVLTPVELNKRFVLSFLHVHGKLFTKVGMEMFTETTNQMLNEFRCLLQYTPAPLSSVRLLQLLAINMFTVANTASKGALVDDRVRPLLQEQALQVSLAMVAIIIERSITLIKEHISGPEYPTDLASDDLSQLLPTLKIWTDWMGCQKTLWFPLPSMGDLRTGCKGDIWRLYANLLNELTKVTDLVGSELQKKSEFEEGFEAVILPEDISLDCFVPLLGAPKFTYYGTSPILDKERARILVRMKNILFFGEYLTGIQNPYMSFDVTTGQFISLIMAPSEENTRSCSVSSDDNLSDEDGSTQCGLEELEKSNDSLTDENSEIRKLWCRQEILKQVKERDERRQAQIQEVLEENRTKRPMEIRIVPRYLIPDTNCFIDHLTHLRLIMKSAMFNLFVPLVVVNELFGLAKGVDEGSSSDGVNSRQSSCWSDKSRQVGLAAQEAFRFLEEGFASKAPKLRCITSKGSILTSITYRSEEYPENKGTNDDLILSCCLCYCDDQVENFMPKGLNVPVKINREVVLLTDDRNLRVKAISRNVPVQTIQDFLKWVNIR